MIGLQSSEATPSEFLIRNLFSGWPIPSIRPPIAAGDITGWRIVQLFHHVNITRFLQLPQERGEGDASLSRIISRVNCATTGYPTEQLIQPMGNKKHKLVSQRSRRINWRADQSIWSNQHHHWLPSIK
jgi:hypothetical protein